MHTKQKDTNGAAASSAPSTEAAAKTAEQIAAEKYGAGAPERVDASPAGEPGALRERARAALGNPGELAKLAKELSPEQIRGL